jgi:hypothetical protein
MTCIIFLLYFTDLDPKKYVKGVTVRWVHCDFSKGRGLSSEEEQGIQAGSWALDSQ